MHLKEKKRKFNKIVSDIKSVKIQGARNVAKAALGAYFLFPNEKSRRILLASRPTEPMMENVLAMAKNHSEKNILTHFSQAQDTRSPHSNQQEQVHALCPKNNHNLLIYLQEIKSPLYP